MINKFTREEADQFTFYRIPKELFTNQKFKSISAEAKILYGLLLDRNSLSRENGWFDNQGYVYIYFSREEVMEMLNIARPKASSLFKELREVELIEEVRQGLTKPNIIYVGKFISSNSANSIDVRISYIRTEEKITSESKEMLCQDRRKSSPNNTDINNTDINNTNFNNNNFCSKEIYKGSKNNTHISKSAQHNNLNINTGCVSDDIVSKLEKEIELITGHQIPKKKIIELISQSSIEQIRYHLSNWHIHKEHQKNEGAGWFFTVVSHNIQPIKKNVLNRDNFEQREYSDEFYESCYTNFIDMGIVPVRKK